LSSLNVSDQDLNSYNTTGRIIILYIVIFKFLDSKLETKDSAQNDSSTVKWRKSNWIGHMLLRNCLPKHDIEGKIEGRV
jgi:hypothetical protein